MYIGLKVSAAASLVSLAAGVMVGYFLFSGTETHEPIKVANEVVRHENRGDFVFEKSEDDRQSHYIENIELIHQLPELPTGCEVTSLTMALRYFGFDAEKTVIADKYLEKSEVYQGTDNKLYGPDYRYIFAGSPTDDKSSFGCMAPCIVSAAQKFLEENNAQMSPVDLTGTDFDDLFTLIDQDVPVIIWSTMSLAAPEYNTKWRTSEGEEIVWPQNEHCVLLTGYDINANTVRIHDPINGIIILNMDAVRERYEQLEKTAVVIIKNK